MKDLYIPQKIRRMIKGKPCVADTVGMSDSQVILFKDCVLKIQEESEESDSESRMMKWLRDQASRAANSLRGKRERRRVSAYE